MAYNLGDTAGATAYHEARGNTAWAVASPTEQGHALTRGQDHIRAGYLVKMDPDLPDPDGLVAQAAYVAALIELGTPGFFSRTFTPGERRVITEVGPIKWQPIAESSTDAMPRSTLIEGLLYSLSTERGLVGVMVI